MMKLALCILLQDVKVREVRDVAYYQGEGADEKKHKLDLYLPDTGQPFPVLMWIHGGGWSMGDRAMYAALGRRFAERGIGCAAISYRLSPGVKHPEHIKDCARAFAWLHSNVARHGGDPDRLFVSGQSAGGHLSALLALDRRYLADEKVPEDALKGTIPMSGVYLILAHPEGSGPMGRMLPQAFGSDKDVCRDASPVTHVKSCAAPMLVITESSGAPLRMQTALLKAAAQKAGVKGIRFADAEDRNHFTIVGRMMREGDDPVRDTICDFVRERCRELDAKK